MPFFKPANKYLDCVSLQVSQSAFRKKFIRKRVYLFTSKGSISVEASIAICSFIMLILFAESYLMLLNTEYSMQTKINNVAIEAAKKMFYVAVLDDFTDKKDSVKIIKEKISESISTVDESFIEVGIEKSYLTTRLVQEIGLKNTNHFLCQVAGINTTESSIKDGIVDLVATYKVEIPFVNRYVTFTQRGKVKTWEGTDITQEKEMVYITTTGRVYHTTKDCQYLNIKIKKTTYDQCKENYKRCEICVNYKPNIIDSVFVTDSGNKYHYSLKCRGLVRNIILVSKDEVEDMSKCSKCSKGE